MTAAFSQEERKVGCVARVLWDESGQGGFMFETVQRRFEVARAVVNALSALEPPDIEAVEAGVEAIEKCLQTFDDPTYAQIAEAVITAAPSALERGTERDELYGYVNGLLGLLQLLRGRDDIPDEVKEIMRTNHRAADAAAYLTQILPPTFVAEQRKDV